MSSSLLVIGRSNLTLLLSVELRLLSLSKSTRANWCIVGPITCAPSFFDVLLNMSSELLRFFLYYPGSCVKELELFEPLC